ncbi:MAG: hypothetical protein U0790_29435 [Isosphaeraceae bacterium]
MPFFAMFGALGWSFGGSISYMQVIGFTHSGHSPSQLYGFACLFVIGFLWAALGGAGTTLPAVAGRRRLIALLPVIGVVFLLWWLQGVAIEPWLRSRGVELNWYDTDWLAALLAMAAAVLIALLRRRVDDSTGLVLYLAGGWWVGFGVLVLALGLRMTPPRGDNWAGCLGMTLGALVYCVRWGLGDVARATIITGVIGGIGFASASMLKLVAVTSGYQTNWHSVLEQTTGLFNGVAIAVAMRDLSLRVGPLDGADGTSRARSRWAEPVALGFVLLLIPYLNLRKNVADWIRSGAVPELMYGIPAREWFHLAFLVVAAGLAVLAVRHLRQPLPVVPESPLGRGQALFLVLLSIMVIGNFERALVGFADQRLITEGVIHLNAVLCTTLLLTSQAPALETVSAQDAASSPSLRRVVLLGLAAAVVSVVLDWAIVRAIYGDRFAGHAGLHIRFGPRATVHSSKGAS